MTNRIIDLDKKPRSECRTQKRSTESISYHLNWRKYPHSANDYVVWVSSSASCLSSFVGAIEWPLKQKLGNLLVHSCISQPLLNGLSALFEQVAAVSNEGSVVSSDELSEIIKVENKADFVIAVDVDQESGLLVLWRGNLSKLVVPLSTFRQTATGMKPDFGDCHIEDFGQTLKFGSYEASVDALLYEYDAIFRKRLKAKRLKDGDAFGDSLRRLRLQRGLKRQDLGSVSSRTIARIERGKSKSPRPRTLKRIADALGVKPEDIASY